MRTNRETLLLGLLTLLIIGLVWLHRRAEPHSVMLAWQAPPPHEGVTVVGYNVYRSAGEGAPFVRISAQKAGPVDHVFTLDERLQQLRIFARLILEVSVLNDDEVSLRFLNTNDAWQHLCPCSSVAGARGVEGIGSASRRECRASHRATRRPRRAVRYRSVRRAFSR
jgi:hypothetical protein